MGLTNWGGLEDTVTSLPAERSLSGAFHPSAAHHQMRACLYSDSGTLSARNRVEKVRNSVLTRNMMLYESLHIFLPQLTKNWLAAFTVGVSGNLSDRIPADKHDWFSEWLTQRHFCRNCKNNVKFSFHEHAVILTTVKQCFHIELLRQIQIRLPFKNLTDEKTWVL